MASIVNVNEKDREAVLNSLSDITQELLSINVADSYSQQHREKAIRLGRQLCSQLQEIGLLGKPHSAPIPVGRESNG